MSLFHEPRDKKRPDNDPRYDAANPVDRKLTRMIFLVVGVLFLILMAIIVLMYTVGS
ncbi:MAG: hypothetical protein ACOX3K_00245 [Bacilli bacterium]|jgi:hypothetical protein